MTLVLRYAARSDVGLVRDGNEDSVYAGPRLLAVADGMGGHAAGEVASRIAIASLAPLDEDVPGNDLVGALRAGLETANRHLRDMVAADNALEGMGTTLTALLWSEPRAALLHIGDSRAYLFRDDELTQITRDHTLVQDYVDEGRISAEEAATHPHRSMITKALDGRADAEPDVSIREVKEGDRYLLCSDGLSGVVTPETMREALLLPSPRDAVDRLVDLALRGGGPDNITCIVADVVADDAEQAAPVLGGAVAMAAGNGPPPDTAAGRAAMLAGRPEPAPEPEPVEAAAGRPRWLIAGIAAGTVLVLLAAAAGGAYAYIRSRWYVGAAAAAAGRQVAIYQGMPGTFAGIALSSVRTRTHLPVDRLQPYEQDQLRGGIEVSGMAAARRVVSRLRAEICVTPSPSPTPTPSRSPRPRPAATSRPKPTPTPSRSPTPSPRPSPSPAIPGCSGAGP